jgi:hypothetical protein
MILAHGIMGGGGGQGKTGQGFQHCKGFEKMECPGIFFFLLSMIPARYHWEKRKLNIGQGLTQCKGFENGNA